MNDVIATDFEALCRQWRDARGRPGPAAADARQSAVEDARKLAQAGSSQTDAEAWLARALAGPGDEARFFAAEVLDGVLPKRLLGPMMAAAVREPNPSFNKSFVRPAVRCAGARAVAEALARLFREGATDERIGALAALYWVPAVAHQFRLDVEDAQGIPQQELLDAFLTTDSAALRRQILPTLRLATLSSGELAAKAASVVELCLASEDDYLRARVRVQLGETSLLTPLPRRDP